MIKNINTCVKIERAKEMMAYVASLGFLENGKYFTPTQYEGYRKQWLEETGMSTPAWSTLKKYANEIGLMHDEIKYEWHSDGSSICEFALCSGLIEDGETFSHTMYYFV